MLVAHEREVRELAAAMLAIHRERALELDAIGQLQRRAAYRERLPDQIDHDAERRREESACDSRGMLADAEIPEIEAVVAEHGPDAGREEREHDRDETEIPGECRRRGQAHRALREFALARAQERRDHQQEQRFAEVQAFRHRQHGADHEHPRGQAIGDAQTTIDAAPEAKQQRAGQDRKPVRAFDRGRRQDRAHRDDALMHGGNRGGCQQHEPAEECQRAEQPDAEIGEQTRRQTEHAEQRMRAQAAHRVRNDRHLSSDRSGAEIQRGKQRHQVIGDAKQEKARRNRALVVAARGQSDQHQTIEHAKTARHQTDKPEDRRAGETAEHAALA